MTHSAADPLAPDGPFAELARVVGVDVRPGDFADEHVRWAVYRAAIDLPEHRVALLRAVRAEPMIALTVALQALERISEDEGAAWVEAVAENDQPFAAARARDVATTRLFSAAHATARRSVVDEWSDWVQRRVVHGTKSRAVLEVLEECGRTRRVRGAARERLLAMHRAVRSAPE